MKTVLKSLSGPLRLFALLVILIAFVVVILKVFVPGFLGTQEGTPVPGTSQSGSTTGSGDEYGLDVGLSGGQAGSQTAVPVPVATGEPLTPQQIEAIFARLPNLPVSVQDQVDFKYPVELLPPPRPGTTITDKFPPSGELPSPQVEPVGPLEVLRYAPQGEIPIAPFISITFNQAMVPLGTLGDLSAESVPVQVDPPLSGTWRWLGTKTLTFEYDSELIDRLPKATAYTVTIPAGTTSINGGVLAQPLSWTFSTPPPMMVSSYPQNIPQPLDPLFFVGFDQRINPAAVLETIQVYAGNEPVTLLLATKAEYSVNEQVNRYVKDAEEGRWLVFKASKPLPADTQVSVTIGPGTPSAEGPLVTTAPQTFSFSTYAPLRVEEYGCSYGNTPCPPLAPFYIRFNNPIDSDSFNKELLTIEPKIPGVTVNLYDNTIIIQGETRGQTTYTVTLSAKIMDIFGQTLGSPQQLTFKVGKAGSQLLNMDQLFVTLDPAVKKPVFSVYAINYSKLAVQIYAVQPPDWQDFTAYMRDWRQTDLFISPPGELVFDEIITLELPDDTLSQVDIDLKPYLTKGFGHFIVIVQPPKRPFESESQKWERYSQTIQTWVQVTHIGLDAFNDHSELVAWATDLKDGSPLAGITIQPDKGGADFTTGSDGTARIPIPSGALYLVASQGADKAMLLASPYFWGDVGWVANPPVDSIRWYVFDDRKMYRPGEQVHIKGWMRRLGGKQSGDVGLLGSQVSSITYQLTDPQGNSIGTGQADVNALGGFDFAFDLPEVINLGTVQLNITAQGSLEGLADITCFHTIQVQEFRRPEFEVLARNETSGPYFAGDKATLAVQAKYYAGGALPDAEVTWYVETTPGRYEPPDWPDFVFGEWQPWWWEPYYYEYSGYRSNAVTETFSGKTDSTGTHYLQLDFAQKGRPEKNPRPMSVLARATVMDVNRQAWTSSTSLLVHPADLYVGLRSERYFVEKGTPLKVDFIVTDLDGKPQADHQVTITAARLEWQLHDGTWEEQEVDPQECKMVSQLEPGTCSFATPVGGSVRLTATVLDDRERRNQTRLTRWVSGGEQPPSRKVEQETVTLIPDQETYQPGDTAQILVQSPFTPAEGLLTVSRSGFLYTIRFQVKDGSTTLSIPIKAEHIPNLNIQVDLVGSAARTNDLGEKLDNVPPRPAYATAQLKLSIPALQRTLNLQVTPAATQLEPGGETSLDLVLKDARGKPVSGAELSVVVVDEAILALTDYHLADPISIFYSDRGSGVASVYGRQSLILANPLTLEASVGNVFNRMADGMFGGAAMAGTQAPMAAAPQEIALESKSVTANQQPSIDVRSDFNPLATFAPRVRTSTTGKARITIKLPDNLTRYRIMVVAVDAEGRQFGMGEANLTARLPLMVRISAPRFLNFGDRFELPVVLQNQTDQELKVQVVARASNLELASAGLQVTVPANDRIEVRFPVSTQMAGTARIQVAAISGKFADASMVELPVYTPATSEAFATYGVIDQGAIAQPMLYPAGVFQQYGGLEISTSSTAVQALTDAVLYLVAYPFECTEQLSSRILAVASLRDILTAFKAEGLPAPADMESAVLRDIKRLQGLQNDDGGFPYWRRGFESVPFNSIHVTHALLRAQQKGFEVPEEMLQGALNYLREIESHYPYWYTEDTRRSLSAYAFYVRNLAGERDASKAQDLFREAGLENLSMETIGWLWSVIDNESQLEAIRTHVNNHVVETAGAANFTTDYDDQTYLLLSSDFRTDAILLDALMEDDPDSDLVVKIVNGLLAHRTRGRWGNTQENVFVLLAMDRYFNAYESQTPDFVARMWLGNTYAGSHAYSGRTTERHETLIPMRIVLAETGSAGEMEDIIISKEGAGRLYYRLGLKYAPTDLSLKPLDMGFVVQRSYEAVDDSADVSQDNDGIWHIKAGARVRVHLTLVADNRRYHVALVDPLPAGLEIINSALAVSQTAQQDDPSTRSYGWWWWGTWYEHQNMRDDRAEAFTSLLWDGTYQYTYLARATSPGKFIVPPAKAEEMYSPEVFGRSSSDWVIVE